MNNFVFVDEKLIFLIFSPSKHVLKIPTMGFYDFFFVTLTLNFFFFLNVTFILDFKNFQKLSLKLKFMKLNM